MRILYYTHSAFWEQALSLVRELSGMAEVHLLVELAPSAWETAAFDLPQRKVGPGLVPADQVLAQAFPSSVSAYWHDVASFHFVVHRSVRSLHPASWWLSREVMQFARSLKIDAMHVDDVDVSPRLALALIQHWEVPLILSVHDPEPHEGEGGWRKHLSRLLAYHRASRFILHNRAQTAGFRQRYSLPAESVHVVELGATEILRAWADPEAAPADLTVLFFGRISPYKGLEVLYAAAPAVAARVPGVRFVVAGKPVPGYAPPRAPVLAAPACIEVIPGYIGNSTLANLLQQATLVVCPYTEATQSGVVLTAYGFERPVVATLVGGLPEYVVNEHTGLLVPPNDPSALAGALSDLLLNAGLRRQLQDGIRSETRKRLNWERAAVQTMEVYRTIG